MTVAFWDHHNCMRVVLTGIVLTCPINQNKVVNPSEFEYIALKKDEEEETQLNRQRREARVKSPQRSAALCVSAAAVPGVSSPLASLLLPSLLPSPPALLLPLSPRRRVSSVVGPAGPH